MAHLVSDGKAVKVSVLYDVDKGEPVYVEGFHGVAMQDAESGETIAIEIAQREHEFVIGSGVAAAKGAILYIAADGTLSATNTDRAFCKVTVAKDANNVIWAILLPQGAESV